jgi:hypothetical protein
MLEIGAIIAEEFNLSEFKTGDSSITNPPAR